MQGLIGLAAMQHQAQPGCFLRNGWRADGNRENPCRLQPLLVLQGWLILPHQQRQDRPKSGGAGPALGCQAISPEMALFHQVGSPAGMRGQKVQSG